MFECDNQNKCDTAILEFIKSLQYDIPTKLKSLSSLLKILKHQNKYSQCSKCKTFKMAGRHCSNGDCTNYFNNVKCPKCGRYFIKLGKHRNCAIDSKMFIQKTHKSNVSEETNVSESNVSESNVSEETNVFYELDKDNKILSFADI